MPDLSQFTNRTDYYAALDAYYAALYGDAENDCE